jgi:hypothetical protein
MNMSLSERPRVYNGGKTTRFRVVSDTPKTMNSVGELSHQKGFVDFLYSVCNSTYTVHAVYYYVEDTNYMFPLCAELIAQIIT